MKKHLSFICMHLWLICSVIVFFGCKKGTTLKDTDPVITSIFPASAGRGETISVYGRNLLKDGSPFSFTINNKPAQLILHTNDSVKAIVPEKAGSGEVAIHIANKTFAAPDLTYNYEVTVTTIAGTGEIGTGDGSGQSATFKCPWGIVAGDDGYLYVADVYNRLIRKISTLTNIVSTIQIPTLIAGSNFYSPYNIAINKKSKSLYATDFNKHVMKVTAAENFSVIYTDNMPLAGIALGPDDKLYISNNTSGEIIRIDTTGQNKTIFSSGIITPRNIIFDKNNIMYVGSVNIYKFNSSGSFSAVPMSGKFNGWEIAIDTSGNFYEADHFNNRIRMIDKKGTITVIAGSGEAKDVDGIGLNASFDGPQGITIDQDGNLYVTTFNYDNNTGNKVRKVNLR